MKTSRTLIGFFLLYNGITLYFISDINRDQSSSLGYVFIFPVFWIIAAIALGLLFWFKKATLKTLWDKLLLFFSTPIPLLLVFVFSRLTLAGLITSSSEYNKNGHRYRKIRYEYSIGQPQRIEFYVSQDTVTETEPFPTSDVWLKDSIWTYYNRDGTIKKTENYNR
ncbi:hypothetical protein [Agriterribacter humi]|uniref:hypothetical protein n=1 Tax=Agriterribacter humi TaxID=1104781 RepID=UPI00126539F5|nr:hypothetical protein [Agriterribacter humi]